MKMKGNVLQKCVNLNQMENLLILRYTYVASCDMDIVSHIAIITICLYIIQTQLAGVRYLGVELVYWTYLLIPYSICP